MQFPEYPYMNLILLYPNPTDFQISGVGGCVRRNLKSERILKSVGKNERSLRHTDVVDFA